MPDFRNSRRAGGGVLLLLWAGLAPAAVAAQQLGPPIPLIPQSLPGAAPAQPSVNAEKLPAPQPGWAAHMAAPSDALPGDFWHGTPRALAELLLAHLPGTTSPALQALERRLLLSPGAPPGGPDAPGYALPRLRAAALLRLGEVDAARAVVAAVPEPQRAPALPLAVSADAIAGDTGRACATVRDRIRIDQSPTWQEALIACQALQGEANEARLGLQLLAEQNIAHDEALRLALDNPDQGGAVARLRNPTPLTLRLLVATHRRLAPALVEGLRSDLALTVALDKVAPVAARLTAAERAARYGALQPGRLAALYAEAATAADARRDGGEGPLARARRFAAIAAAASAGERLMRIVAFADAFAAAGGDRALAARLVAPALHAVTPDPAYAGSAAAAARLLLLAGDADAARRWVAIAPQTELPGLRLLMRLAGRAMAPGVETVADRIEPGHQMLAAALLAGLGEPMAVARLPAIAWSAAARPAVPAAAWLDLAEAAAARRIGETILAATMVVAANGALATDPIVLAAALSGLERVGCDADARRLAVEAAIAAGI